MTAYTLGPDRYFETDNPSIVRLVVLQEADYHTVTFELPLL